MDYEQECVALKAENPFLSQAELAYQIILRRIVCNELPAGEKIHQEYFANALGMSRSPIREALIALEKDGYVVKNDNSGYYVYQIKLKDYVDFFEFRIQIESYAAYLSARCITDEQLKKLKENLDQYVKCCENGQQQKMAKLDIAFHDIIVESCDNAYVQEVYSWMMTKRNMYIGYFERAGRLERAKKGHINIYKAIANQEEEKAREAMAYHLKYYLRSLYTIM